MTPFEQALIEEERWVARVIDQPMPTDARAGHRIYVGPTAATPMTLEEREYTPASMRPKNQPLKPPGEDSEWKRIRQDLRARLHGHSLRRFD